MTPDSIRFVEAVRWSEDGRALDLLDQTRLTETELRLRLRSAEEVAEAIRALRVRGAPAIGIAAAMGVALEMERHTGLQLRDFRARLDATCALLEATRPTAVNLRWALERLRRCAVI
jgi:methylthioribose-1-phosphate isomerase